MENNNNNEIMFYEKGLALIIANLDYGYELISDAGFKDADSLLKIVDLYNEVDDFDKWKEINSMLEKFNKTFFEMDEFKNNLELFILLNTPIYINKYLDNLLVSSNYKDISDKEVESYLKDNFHTTISKILDIKDLDKNIEPEFIEVAKILVKENKQKDIVEGMEILFGFMMNEETELNEIKKEAFNLLLEADSIASFMFFLKEPLDIEE